MKEHNKIKEDNTTQTATQTLVKEILRFNKAHNIVGRFTEKEIISLDVLDCETILKHIPAKKEILDIGSGAGLPGLIIAIHQPNSNVTMSEKNKKKAYFIKKIIRTLELENATILDEAITPSFIIKKKFDIITARALATAPKITQMSKHLLAKNGKFLLLKGALEKINEEVAQLDNNTYSYTIHRTNITHTSRHILEINPK